LQQQLTNVTVENASLKDKICHQEEKIAQLEEDLQTSRHEKVEAKEMTTKSRQAVADTSSKLNATISELQRSLIIAENKLQAIQQIHDMSRSQVQKLTKMLRESEAKLQAANDEKVNLQSMVICP
jgi:Flp pilus assembly CpaE family ATPase